jgi:hypothetical protein
VAVPAGRRLFVAVVIGVFSAVWTTVRLRAELHAGDFGQIWFAARALLSGGDPYDLIGPGKPFAMDFSFRYPLPAVLVAVPMTPLNDYVASGLVIGLGLGCLAWALMRNGHAPLLGLMSAAIASALSSVQWSPLLAAATVLAPLGVLYVAKPTIGLAMFIARPSRWAIVGGIGLMVVAFLIQPNWLAQWRNALTDRTGTATLALHPGGALALLALIKWRRPEARMLAVLACVPMTPALYETVPLLLIPRRWWEAALLVAASYGVAGWVMRMPLRDIRDYAPLMATSADAIALTLLPLATFMVLRRPNEGSIPAWLERRIVRWPRSLRGTP